jgi:elongator complex protein 3
MKEVFANPDFCPDFVKIYPCVVLETAELKNWWKDGKYKPYDDEDLVKLLIKWEFLIPEWTRVMRLMRDIPVGNILAGAKFSNLRQILTDQPKKLREIVGDDFYVENKLDKRKWQPRDIRSREIGFADLEKISQENLIPVLKRRDYQASDGLEVFLSFESPDEKHLFALLRLRKSSGKSDLSEFSSVLKDAGVVREVHSYGTEISVGSSAGIGQHRGLGAKLLAKAEQIASEEWGLKRMTIIAGVGTREYYRKFDYQLRQTYMTKKIGK